MTTTHPVLIELYYMNLTRHLVESTKSPCKVNTLIICILQEHAKVCSRVNREVAVTKDQFVTIKETVDTMEMQTTDWEKILATSLTKKWLYLGNTKDVSKCRREERLQKRQRM